MVFLPKVHTQLVCNKAAPLLTLFHYTSAMLSSVMRLCACLCWLPERSEFQKTGVKQDQDFLHFCFLNILKCSLCFEMRALLEFANTSVNKLESLSSFARIESEEFNYFLVRGYVMLSWHLLLFRKKTLKETKSSSLYMSAICLT